MKKRGRPVGQFARNTRKLHRKLTDLCNPLCWASNKFLAEQMGCCTRQVNRYLTFLKQDGKIRIQIYRFQEKGLVKSRRFIGLIQKPESYHPSVSPARPEPQNTQLPVPVTKVSTDLEHDGSGYLAKLQELLKSAGVR